VRRFAVSYYGGMLILVFILYASFVRSVAPSFWCFVVGLLAGGAVIVMIASAMYVAWHAKDVSEEESA